jgi:hypothetical protein
MTRQNQITRAVLLTLLGLGFAPPMGRALAQDTPKTKGERGPGTNVVWVYRNGEGKRTPSELYFGSGPTYFSPESKALDISLNAAFPVADLGDQGEGSCIELVFPLASAIDWASAGFIPGGSIGAKPAYNVAEHLAPELGRPVFLRFRARTKAGERVRVKFTSGNFALGALKDGVRPAQRPRNTPTLLTDRWTPVEIDLTPKAAGLESVVVPLQITATAVDNPGKQEVTVYVDDVRYEVGGTSSSQ